MARRSLIERQQDYTGLKKSRASLSPEQLRRLDLKSSKQSISFSVYNNFGLNLTTGARDGSPNPTLHLDGTEQSQDVYFGEEPNEREKHLLAFCEQQQEKLKRALNKTYKEGKSIGKIDETQKRLKKLMPAKLALA